jgi:hypothetical protein
MLLAWPFIRPNGGGGGGINVKMGNNNKVRDIGHHR